MGRWIEGGSSTPLQPTWDLSTHLESIFTHPGGREGGKQGEEQKAKKEPSGEGKSREDWRGRKQRGGGADAGQAGEAEAGEHKREGLQGERNTFGRTKLSMDKLRLVLGWLRESQEECRAVAHVYFFVILLEFIRRNGR